MEIKEFFKKMGEKLNCLRQAGFKYNFFGGTKTFPVEEILGGFHSGLKKNQVLHRAAYTRLCTNETRCEKRCNKSHRYAGTILFVNSFKEIRQMCFTLHDRRFSITWLTAGCLTFNTSIRDESGLVSAFSLQVVHRAWKNSSRFWWKRNTSSRRQPPYNK